MDFEVLVLSVLDGHHVQSRPVWEHEPSGFLLTKCGEMGLVTYAPDKDMAFGTAARVTDGRPLPGVLPPQPAPWAQMAALTVYLGARGPGRPRWDRQGKRRGGW